MPDATFVRATQNLIQSGLLDRAFQLAQTGKLPTAWFAVYGVLASLRDENGIAEYPNGIFGLSTRALHTILNGLEQLELITWGDDEFYVGIVGGSGR